MRCRGKPIIIIAAVLHCHAQFFHNLFFYSYHKKKPLTKIKVNIGIANKALFKYNSHHRVLNFQLDEIISKLAEKKPTS